MLATRRSFLAGALAPSSRSASFLAAVREFAANVLRYGRDTYGKPTPLFVDGVHVDTHQPVRWKSRDGREWALSDLGNQQILFRTLSGLSALSGDPQFRRAAEDATRYALANLVYKSLLAWGGHTAYDATEDRIFHSEDKGVAHELKCHFPYYSLMWDVDRAAARALIETIWNSHVLDWSILDFNRHGAARAQGALWQSDYKGGEVFFWGKGLTFHNAASDLYYAAGLLAKFTGEALPLEWARRLAHRYVETRNPKTGISGFQFSQMASAWCDDVGKIRGDRAIYQYAEDFPGRVVYEGTLFPCYGSTPLVSPWICQMDLADELGVRGGEFGEWARQELTAWGRSAYREKDNSFIPMLTDGTSMEGYIHKKDGYFGPKGRVMRAGRAGARDFWTYAMGARQSRDPFLWKMARSIAAGAGYGDIGAAPGAKPALRAAQEHSDPAALLGWLELHRAAKREEFLDAARQVGGRILEERFHRGFFVKSRSRQWARFDAVEPLALLHLAARLEGREAAVPSYNGGSGFFASAYGSEGHKYDEFLYNRE